MKWSLNDQGVLTAYFSSSVIYGPEEEKFSWTEKKNKVPNVQNEAVDFFADLKKRHKLVIVKRKEENISLDEAEQLVKYLIDLNDGYFKSKASKKILDGRFYVCFGNIYIIYPFRKIVPKQERRKIVITQNCLGQDTEYYWDYGDKIEYVRSRNWAKSLHDQYWDPYIKKVFYDQDSFDHIRRNACEEVVSFMLSEILKTKSFREIDLDICQSQSHVTAKKILDNQKI